MVEEGNLFDPARPSLGSELEALRQHLEALRSGLDTWESHLDRPAGAPWVGGAVRVLGAAEPRALVSAGFEAQLVHFLPWACVCLGPCCLHPGSEFSGCTCLGPGEPPATVPEL